MENKEKAIHLAENNLDKCFGSKRDYGVTCALEMAQWKDEQFEKKLQEIVDYVYPLICGGERIHINKIIGKDMEWQHK